MRVLMQPTLKHFRSEESGIKRVVEAYYHYLPKFGVSLVDSEDQADLIASHIAGDKFTYCDVSHNHGLYWTADYPAISWEWAVNSRVTEALRYAKEITVPSSWVAETVKRDMRRTPHVVGHGIEWANWQGTEPVGNYVLWNKNRMSDVCDPGPMDRLSELFPGQHFISTFSHQSRNNVHTTGVVDHDEMMSYVQNAQVYLATTKETFGIGILEAMAAGIPVLGYAHGGILDLVEHGVTGYLAEPGDMDDLAEGLDYCKRFARTLGENGREASRQYDWESVCEKIVKVYELALRREEPGVTVVIPSYNYADKVGRAIESVLGQTFENIEVIVVDDGSDDGGATQKVATESYSDSRLRYVRQNNQGVAHARNNGISLGAHSYVCCLDADDRIEPTFLETCVGALEQDNSLGIAYTGLYTIFPDGRESASPWPGEWDFDAQIKRQNQVPTCCVYRRDMWEQLGGYRQRYAPQGAGSEDAEFWTRSGAYGWRAEKVTGATLFHYSYQSGRVSGNPEYREEDWLAWHPWVEDEQHPFASYATAKKYSHPVRAYDEPVISVVIPVGPGHEKQVVNALDSLDSQTFRQWEVIVVDDSGTDLLNRKPWPHAMFVETDGEKGAGKARNIGAEYARGVFLLFLDADDWLIPMAMDRMLAQWRSDAAIIYSDYMGKAVISEEHAQEMTDRLMAYDPASGEAVIRHYAQDYDWRRAQRQPEGPRPWIWCNVTSLVPRAWHDQIGGFDEQMPSWEDVDYWYRMALAGKPMVRVEEPLLVYQFYSGSRRDKGVGLNEQLVKYMTDKYKEVEKVACTGCGSSKNPPAMKTRATVLQAPSTLDDSQFEQCVYTAAHRNQTPLVGTATFEQRLPDLHMVRGRQGYMIHYGFRAGGDQFLVHKSDIALMGNVFQPIQRLPDVAPPRAETPPPRPLTENVPEPELIIEEPVEKPLDLQLLPGTTLDIARQLEERGLTTKKAIALFGEERLRDELKGVGPARAKMIMKAVSE